MKWIGLIVIAVIYACVLGGSERSFVPYATAADSVQKATALDSLPPIEAAMATAAADSVQKAIANLNEFMSTPPVLAAFMGLIREDKEARVRTGTESPSWLAAKRNPRAYLTGKGVTVPEEIAVTFLYTVPTGSRTGGLYSFEAGIGRRGGRCTSTAHPEKTGCFVDRRTFPFGSIVTARRV